MWPVGSTSGFKSRLGNTFPRVPACSHLSALEFDPESSSACTKDRCGLRSFFVRGRQFGIFEYGRPCGRLAAECTPIYPLLILPF